MANALTRSPVAGDRRVSGRMPTSFVRRGPGSTERFLRSSAKTTTMVDLDPREYYAAHADREFERLTETLPKRLAFEHTVATLADAFPETGRVLDAGGGPGRYGLWLADRGYDVVHCDVTPELVALAREKAADADDGLDETELRDQLVTFLGAGHETTATALTYAIWLLAGNPEVRERLDAELDAVLDGDEPTFATLPELEYTEAVVDEALRLYPPVYSIYREAREPTTVGGYRVDPGETIQLSTVHVHHDDRWWAAPEAFRPKRWLDDDSDVPGVDDVALAFGNEDRPAYAYFPFGGGPRHCIGMRFARMELKFALATLASHLAFERVGGFDPEPKIVLDPGDVRVRATKR